MPTRIALEGEFHTFSDLNKLTNVLTLYFSKHHGLGCELG